PGEGYARARGDAPGEPGRRGGDRRRGGGRREGGEGDLVGSARMRVVVADLQGGAVADRREMSGSTPGMPAPAGDRGRAEADRERAAGAGAQALFTGIADDLEP